MANSWRRFSDAISTRVHHRLRRNTTSSSISRDSVSEQDASMNDSTKPTRHRESFQVQTRNGSLQEYQLILEEGGLQHMERAELIELCAHYVVHAAALTRTVIQLQLELEQTRHEVAIRDASHQLSETVACQVHQLTQLLGSRSRTTSETVNSTTTEMPLSIPDDSHVVTSNSTTPSEASSGPTGTMADGCSDEFDCMTPPDSPSILQKTLRLERGGRE